MAWGAVAAAAISAIGSGIGQSEANSANVSLNRENRAFQKMMSDTAIRRRKIDLLAAGLNPALAVTQGAADTPSTSPATVENELEGPAKHLAQGVNSAIAMQQAKANINMTKASTAKELALADQAKVEADIRRKLVTQETDYRLNKFVEGYEQTDLDTLIKRAQADMTAAQVTQFQKMMPDVLEQASNLAKEGKLNVQALENISKLYGIEAGKLTPIFNAIISFFTRTK